jgi:hypothetical protein
MVPSFLPDCSFMVGPNSEAMCVKLMKVRFLGGIDLFFLLTIIPGVLFMCYLLAKLKLSVTILKSTDSLVLPTIYTFVWLVCVFNLLFALLTILVASTTYKSPTGPATNQTVVNASPLSNITMQNHTREGTLDRLKNFMGPDNVPSLPLDVFARLCQSILSFIIEFIELSVIVFMMHFGTTLSNSKVLIRTSLISGLISFADNALGTITTFVFQLSSFEYKDDDSTIKVSPTMLTIPIRESALYEVVSSVIFCILYSVILLLPLTKYRDRVPERRTFYFYILFLMFINVLQVIGGILILSCVPGGICFMALSKFVYFAVSHLYLLF